MPSCKASERNVVLFWSRVENLFIFLVRRGCVTRKPIELAFLPWLMEHVDSLLTRDNVLIDYVLQLLGQLEKR